MRIKQLFVSLAALLTASIFFVTIIMYSPMSARAGALKSATAPSQTPHQHVRNSPPLSGYGTSQKRQKPGKAPDAAIAWPEAEVIIARPRLDLSDEVATLKALQRALDEVGDGSSYVWYRANGRLSGIIKPTKSFRDAKGQVCRHLEVWLTAGTDSKKTESIACRQQNRVWAFES